MTTNTDTKAYADAPHLKTGWVDVVKHRFLYLTITILLLIPGGVFMVLNAMDSPYHSPLKLGIDFVGGTFLEYGFEKKLTQDDLPKIRAIFTEKGYENPVVQIQQDRNLNATKETKALTKTEKSISETGEITTKENKQTEINTVVSVRTKPMAEGDAAVIQAAVEKDYGNLTVLQKYSMGPSFAKEILNNGFMAMLLAYILITAYLAFRFQLDFALVAIVTLVHDALFVVGCFAILGYFFHTEVDSMFVTAILTVVGFSVHDTIVVFDRIRENYRILFTKKLPFTTITNLSINQTLGRSINTSLTVLLTLLALYLFGGVTTKDFVLAMLLGIGVGTYSSIFVASMLLAWWRERNEKVLGASSNKAQTAAA